jgi:hypothetical protein
MNRCPGWDYPRLRMLKMQVSTEKIFLTIKIESYKYGMAFKGGKIGVRTIFSYQGQTRTKSVDT